jgi:formylglycine-generating enzyme required for sulfatase activity
MARYNSQRRRSGSAAWQWIVIGMVLGFACSVILVLGALAAGLMSLDPNRVANAATQTPFIITATPAPVTPTLTPTLGQPAPTQGIMLEVQAPTASPTIPATLQTLQPTSAPTTQTAVGGSGGEQLSSNSRFTRTMNGRSEIVEIAGGTYQMGTTLAELTAAVQECIGGYGGDPGTCQPAYGEDSFPQHPVTVSTFNLETTEVTYAQYLTFLNEMGPGSHRNGCNGMPCMETRNDSETSNVSFDSANYSVPSVISDFPVTNVTWYGAQAYCEAIGRRLPTEAEWERAARGDQGYIYPWGNTWDGSRATTRRLADGTLGEAVSVLTFPLGSSPYGVLNMAGNVAEWVYDWYDLRYYANPNASQPDPTGPLAGTEKVNRGGSWDTMPFFARTVHRRSQDPLDPTADIGFRCAEDIGAENSTAPVGADVPITGGSDLALPTNTPNPATLGTNEEQIDSAPTVPPAPTRAAPTGTLAAG